jgi:glutaconyl-CoA decarboxylase
MFCPKNGLVDEILPLCDLRKYLVAFAGAAYQNPSALSFI